MYRLVHDLIHLGRGEGRLALASTPVLLLLQIALLPMFLWLLLGPEATVRRAYTSTRF